MTQEEKQLLLIDLFGRLPYGVCVHIRYKTGEPCYGKLTLIDIQWFIDSKIENIKPYLRPISSMTEDEKVEYCNLQDIFLYSSQYPVTDSYALFDWLNSHHFDYRGLIPMGLAIEVTESNNPYE